MKKRKLQRSIFIGDFNARVSDADTIINIGNRHKVFRRSKDRIKNSRGKDLIETARNCMYKIVNGKSISDCQGEFTFMNKNGSSVFDVCLTSEKAGSLVRDFKVLGSVYSHHSLILLQFDVQREVKTVHESYKYIKWKPDAASAFSDSLLDTLGEFSDKRLSFESLSKCIFKSAENCNIVQTRVLGMTKISGPRWFN